MSINFMNPVRSLDRKNYSIFSGGQ